MLTHPRAVKHALALVVPLAALSAGPSFAASAVVVAAANTTTAPAKSPPPGIPEAFAAFRKGDAEGAAGILENLTGREPGNALAWRYLGFFRLKARNLDAAVAACTKALDLAPGTPQILYNLGAAFALKHEKDRAFEWLEKARASRADLTGIERDKDLEELKGDPRFAKLLPRPEEFADPFVEKVKVLREWDGEAADDQFGWIARSIGDADGDGVNDVVTSAPTKEIGGAAAGRVYLYSTRDGRRLWTVDGHPGDQLGLGIEGAGDVNHDGVPDVIAGAPGAGETYVYSGKDGSVLLTLKAEKKDDAFGRHVSAAGDVNGDGHADVLVGAPQNDAAGEGAGRAYLYSGAGGRLLLTLSGEGAGDAFGSTVGGARGAARSFLIVGAPGAGPRKTGRAYVYDGASQKPKFVIDSDETGAALGAMFVSVLGDVDADGTADIYASDWSNAALGPSTGRIYVHSGKDGRRLLTLTGTTTGEGFGIGPADAGDVDGDGRADLIVGSWQYAGAAMSGGRATLQSGDGARVLATYTCRVPGDTLGFEATGLGDVDGDGTIDLLLTSAWSGVRGYHSGRVFVVSSGVRAESKPPASVPLEKRGPSVGQTIPPFRAPDQSGAMRDLPSLAGEKGLVLLFVRSADW